jgi:flagellar basal body-associated protein FliL
MTTPTVTDDRDFRLRLAQNLITYALIAISIVVVLMLVGQILIITPAANYDKEKFNAFFDVGKYVLGVILPVVSAWVGTVMAFYFSRENYESAVRSTATLVRQITTSAEKLKATSVRQAMIPIAEAHTLTIDDPKTALLQTLIDVEMKNFNRLPVLTKEGLMFCILHKSTVNDFLVLSGLANAAPLTLQDLLDKPAFVETVQTKGMAFVGSDVNLDTVKEIMDQEPRCLDVFVTKEGNGQSKAIGWITNAILLKAAQV